VYYSRADDVATGEDLSQVVNEVISE